jgi:uncharacterized protein YegP (UPF0339 family)
MNQPTPTKPRKVRTLHVYKGEDGQFYIRIRSKNREKVGDLAEGYATRANARRALRAMCEAQLVAGDDE